MAWKRLLGAEKHQRKQLEKDGLEGRVFRIYGKNGKQWPRICIGVSRVTSEPYIDPGFKPYVAWKDNVEDWWNTEAMIPWELYSDLLELLEEAKARLE